MTLIIENKDRGEKKIMINKQAFLLSLNFAAIAKIQSHFGESILMVASKCWEGKLLPEDMAVIIILASGQDKKISVDAMAEAIMVEGLVKVAKKVNDFMALAINGGRVGKKTVGKSKAAKAKKS